MNLKKLILPVQRIDTERHCYVVRYQGDYYTVKQYPFQYELRTPETLKCVNMTPNAYTPTLVQDVKTVIEDIYEEGVPYPFTVVNTHRGEDNTLNVELKDEYGFKHIYPDAGRNAVLYIGKTVEIEINKIEEDGTLIFCVCYELEDKKALGHATLSERDSINFDKLYAYNLDVKKYLVDDPNFNGLWKSIIDKYPDKAHFIYELLQNADDAKASKVGIILYRDGLIFKHNGTVPFSVTDPEDQSKLGHINSITYISRSTKATGISNTIGKFGVGFKAVFSYTKRPEIYDDKFWFALEDYIVPIRLKEDHPMRAEKETLFYFPFKNTDVAYDEIMKKLRSLQNPNLFLNNITEIDWSNESGDRGHYSKIIRKQYSVKGIKCQLISLVNNKENEDLWLFSKAIEIEDYGWYNISVGYYLNSNGEINTSSRHKVYCFFPTSEKVDLCCILHAPFLLTDNRQNITDSQENRLMIGKLANLAASALPILRDEGLSTAKALINDNIFKIVPLDENRWDDDAISKNIFFEAYKDIIKQEALLLSRNDEFLNVSDSIIPGRQEIVDIIDRTQLNKLLKNNDKKKDFVCVDSCSDDDVKNYLHYKLEIDSFGYPDLARCITPEFMQSQSKEWISKFYYSILDNAKQLLKSKKQSEMSRGEQKIVPLFRITPIFKSQNGEWLAPYKGAKLDTINIYKPTGVISSRINVVCKEHFELKNCQSLLDYLEIGEPNRFDQVKESLLKYEGEHFTVDNSQILDDFETFLSYFIQSSGEERLSFIEKIKDYNFVVAGCYGKKNFLYKAKDIFASTPILEQYLKGDTKKADLILFDEEFYKSLVKKYGIASVNEFLFSLGANGFPKIRQVEISSYNLLNEEHKKIADRCSHSTRTRSYFDYQLPGFEFAVKHENITKEISRLIWSRLVAKDPSAVLFTVKYFYYSDQRKYGNSHLITLLKSCKWLFTKTDGPFKPSDISITQICEAGYEYNNKWFSYLGILPDKSDIMALGGTQEQQDIQDKGQLFKDCSYEDAQRAKYLLEQEKAREKEALQKRTQADDKKDSTSLEPSRKKMEDNTLADMFSSKARKPDAPSAQLSRKDKDTSNKDIEAFAKKLDEEKETKLRLEELRQSVSSMEKYSMEWFSSLMLLELKATGEDEYQSSSGISISFAEVQKDSSSERIYILKNPSRLIPMELEDIGGLSVSFTFRNADSFSKSFDVACVRNFSLLVKANSEDAASLAKINWKECSKAEISINNVSDLEKKLCYAFEQLGLPADYNLKDNLNPDISFVFGPPGTGKTTYLSKEITNILEVEKARILVLTPTNKACDVLTLKLLSQSEENYSRVGRFVATAEAEIEDSGILKSKDSDFYKKRPCCLVSTIARLPYDGFQSGDGEGSLRDIDWDYVIIDEASMIPIAHISYAIYKFKSVKIIIAGDPLQIAPIAHESEWKDENIYTMTNLLTFTNPKTEPVQFDITYLSTQYRSVPEIGNLFSNYAYAGLLKNYREAASGKPLDIDGFNFGAINFMPFRVDRYDSLYGAKKLNNSNIHIYSALLVVEFAKYVSKKYTTKHPGENLSIGIICPYAPQAHLINNLFLQQKSIPESVKITVGTIHGFQGDECDVIISVFNPPTGLKGAANSVLINNRNIVNVAISRAKDYLFIFMPSSETDGFDKLFELNMLGNIAKRHCKDVKVFNSDQLETIIFHQRLYLERHSFVTSHQLANIYTEAQAKYEIRIDNSAIDVQIDNNL